MSCTNCGAHAPTHEACFRQNIGALVIRFTTENNGHFCSSCGHSLFWKHTLVNLTLGWWGMISLIINPIFIVLNLVNYVPFLTLAAEHEDDEDEPFADEVDDDEPFAEQVDEDESPARRRQSARTARKHVYDD